MNPSSARILLVLISIAFVPVALAQWPPQELKNIQVLPEGTSPQNITPIMREFAGALGVRCIHCHVGDDPNDLASTDFVSDQKIEKQKARAMIRMVREINEKLLTAVPGRSDPPVEVSCRTCHHSVTRPMDIRDLLAETHAAQGIEATIMQYQALREQYFGSDSYDFRHFMLANVAEQLAREHPADAIRLLEFNGELHPASGQTFFTLAQVYRGMGDEENSVRSIERAVEAEPDNAWYRGILDRIKAEQSAESEGED